MYKRQPQFLAGVLTQQNIVSPGGTLEAGRDALAIEPSGSFESLAEIRAAPVPVPGGSVLSLGDIVEVTEGTVDPPTPVFRYKGESAHLVGISLKTGGNIIKLGDDIKRVVEEMHGELPIGLELEIANFQPEDVQVKVSSFASNLVQAVVLSLIHI